MNVKSTNPSGLGWLLLAVSFSFPWLIPVHTAPLPTFFTNISAALVIVPIALWSFLKSHESVKLDHLALGFTVAAALPLLQAAVGMFSIPSEAPVVSLHLLGLALTIAMARHCDHMSPDKLLVALFCGLLVAGVVSVGLALTQWLQIDSELINTNLMVKLPSGYRPYANLAQSNDLSTLLVWGIASVLWLQITKRINVIPALILTTFLLLGVIATKSRTGLVALMLLSLIAIFLPIKEHVLNLRLTVFFLNSFYIILAFFWDAITNAIGLTSDVRSLNSVFSSNLRFEIWDTFVSGIGNRPFFGYGWDQGRMVQMDDLQTETRLPILVQHAHNIVIDLIIWNGLPIGVTFVILLAAWFYWQIKKSKTASQRIIIGALAVLVLHSMLELPHLNVYFLAPAGIMMGTLNNRTNLPWKLEVNRWIAISLSLGMTIIFLVSIKDYGMIEKNLIDYRIYIAKIQSSKNYSAPHQPNIYVLKAVQSALLNLRIEPNNRITSDELNRLKSMVIRYPMESTYLRYAQALALNERFAEAQLYITRWCTYQPASSCLAIQNSWKRFQTEIYSTHNNNVLKP